MDPVAAYATFFISKDGRTKKSFFKEGTSMEMCYAGAIAMPSSYVVMNEEEMTYTEGGVRIEQYWWGRYEYYTHREAGFIVIGGMALLIVAGAPQLVSFGPNILWFIENGNGLKLRYTNGIGYTGAWSWEDDRLIGSYIEGGNGHESSGGGNHGGSSGTFGGVGHF
jgi:hypothetical protein